MQWSERIGNRLKMRDLHIFLVVVERGSMARAAAELAISQPAVSKAIADIEHALGLRLMDRSRQGVEPTTYGRVLARRAVAIFDELKQGVAELEFLADSGRGELRVGSAEAMAAGVLPEIIRQFSRKHPRVTLNIVQAVFATQHYLELRDRSIDVLFGRIPASFSEADLDVQPLFDDQVVVVAGRQSRWACRGKLALADLADERWILPPPGSMPGLLAAELFRAAGVEPPHTPLTTLSIHLACKLAASGDYVATLPRSVIRFGGTDLPLKVLPIKLPTQARPVCVVTLKHRTLNPIARVFIDCARDATAILRGGRPTQKIGIRAASGLPLSRPLSRERRKG